jgi:hypothetical protein
MIGTVAAAAKRGSSHLNAGLPAALSFERIDAVDGPMILSLVSLLH